jgi:predicted nucleic-acid-binding Zn-ribbon protein
MHAICNKCICNHVHEYYIANYQEITEGLFNVQHKNHFKKIHDS